MFHPLNNGENLLGKWTINYIAPDNSRYLGELDVTDQNLYFDGKFDMSFSGIVKEALFVQTGSAGYLCIPKNMIAKVHLKKSFLKKQVILTLNNGQIHTFDYGAMSIDKLAEAIG